MPDATSDRKARIEALARELWPHSTSVGVSHVPNCAWVTSCQKWNDDLRIRSVQVCGTDDLLGDLEALVQTLLDRGRRGG